MNTTPVSLLDRLRQPNADANWARFVELYTPLLYHWVRDWGASPAEAADLVQDLFLLLLRKLPEFTYQPGRSFCAWLRTVALNKWRESLRRRAVPQAHDRADVIEAAGPDVAAELGEAEYRQFLIDRALRVMQRDFAPSTWKAFWEVVANGRPAAEVAQEFSLSLKAVYEAKARVLRRLRQELHGLLD